MNKILLLSAIKMEHHSNELNSIPIHITGLGKINAAHMTTRLIKDYDPEIIVNFGSCGNLKNYNIGEVLEVGKVYNNIDARPLANYGETPFDGINVIDINKNSSISCFTTDQFYHKSEKSYRKEFFTMIKKCDIVDMELYAIAWCCKKMNKKLFSFKWISDDGNSHNWELNAAKGYENFKKIFMKRFL